MSFLIPEVVDKPKSKWPYWVVYKATDDELYSAAHFRHYVIGVDLDSKGVDVQVQKSWRKIPYTMFGVRKEQKHHNGFVYKFSNEQDRLLFLIEYAK